MIGDGLLLPLASPPVLPQLIEALCPEPREKHPNHFVLVFVDWLD
jgi:hypothetical protein